MNNQNIRLLLVEDDPLNQMVTTNVLKRLGVTVTIARTGSEALSMITTKAFHLILMDLFIPVIDGAELTKRVRALDDFYFKSVPIIAFTACDEKDAWISVHASGMTDLLTKPFGVAEMKNILMKYTNPEGVLVTSGQSMYSEGTHKYR
ncbi:MAG: response regulator [Cyclobacteriaceae bacterium]|nr:response regulator [Cyclobacteriaceae bacterium]